jgi:hypothetical protein
MTVLDTIKQCVWNYRFVKNIVSKTYNFLCIITPVFDPAYDSINTLILELQAQTFGRFIHVMISNGSSPRIRDYIFELSKHDPRFIYVETKAEITSNALELFLNVCKRRSYGLKNYRAERYLFLDADAKLVDNSYFMKLHSAHQEIKRDILITLVKIHNQSTEIILPLFPIKFGHIDLANFSVSKKIARKFNYPTDHDANIGYGSDYRFFSRIATDNNTALLNFISTIRDGNNTYKRLSELLHEDDLKYEDRK